MGLAIPGKFRVIMDTPMVRHNATTVKRKRGPKIQGLHLEGRQYLHANAEPNNPVALDFPLTGLS